jgi:hypothetical protein
MDERDFELNAHIPGELIERYISIELKDLEGQTLTDEEKLFLMKMEFSSMLVDGVLENALLEYGLERGIRAATKIAASTERNPLDEAIEKALKSGQSSVIIDIGGEELELLRIQDADVATPCYQQGYRYLIERRGQEEQEVDPAGLINISIRDVKKMRFSFDRENRIIKLRESDAGSGS